MKYNTLKFDKKSFLNIIAEWFKKNRQPHFFRFNRNPYRVWVTEVILQQTRLQYALPKLKIFLQKFPNLRSLAEANENKVLAAFQGLGYYNRAINLHIGAQYIYNNLKGEFPCHYKSLLMVPSIGHYTASAIASICFKERRPAIDGNLKRIYSRLCLAEEVIQSTEFHKKCESYFTTIFSEMQEDPGLINEALMELGQRICMVSSPKCTLCPLNNGCLAFLQNKVTAYPKIKKRPQKKKVIWLLFLIEQGNKLLLQKDKTSYFLKNQWSLPSIIYFPEEKKRLPSYVQTLPKMLKVKFESMANLFLEQGMCNKPIRHTITSHKIYIYTQSIETSHLVDESHEIQWCSIKKLQSILPSRAIQKATSVII